MRDLKYKVGDWVYYQHEYLDESTLVGVVQEAGVSTHQWPYWVVQPGGVIQWGTYAREQELRKATDEEILLAKLTL